MKRIYIIGGVALLMAGLVSCKGRRADDTPNGETVEVVLSATVSETDTDTVTAEPAEPAEVPAAEPTEAPDDTVPGA